MKFVWMGIFLGILAPRGFSCLTKPIQGSDLISGKSVTLATDLENSKKKGTVIVFLSAKCPCSKSHEPVVEKLSKEFSDFQFVAIHSNQDESVEFAKRHFVESGLSIPVIQDVGANLANELKAFKTPHAFVVGPQGQCWFNGGIDDTRKADRATQEYLRKALLELQKGKDPEEKVVRTLGCVIKR